MKIKIVKGACIVASGIVLLGALFMLTAYLLLFRPNFMRLEGPYTHKQNMLHWGNEAFEKHNYADAAWFEQSDRVRLEITSFDGLKLVAYYLPHEESKGIVLMMHGFHSLPMRDFASIARFYYDHGYSICLPYQRTHGESEGTYITYGVKERYDIRDWVAELNERYGLENDIWVHGISMGCATVLMGSGFEYPFNVRGIIADCGFTSPYDIIHFVLKYRKIPLPTVMVNVGDFYAKLFAKFSLHDYSTVKALSVNETPLLFIHGTADTFVPSYMTLANFEATHAPKELLLVDDAIHAMSFYTNEEQYGQAVLSFMQKYALIR